MISRVTWYGSHIILYDGECSSNACMCIIYLWYDTMFQTLWFYEDFNDSGCCYQVSYRIKVYLSLYESWSFSFDVDLIATMTIGEVLYTVMSSLMSYHLFVHVPIITRRVSLVEQELLTIFVHLSSKLLFYGFGLLRLYFSV